MQAEITQLPQLSDAILEHLPGKRSAPLCKNTVSANSNFMHNTSFYLERFQEKLADDQCSSITEGSIYHVSHVYIQPFTTVVDWPEIVCLMEVSIMFNICRYCVFTWRGRVIDLIWYQYKGIGRINKTKLPFLKITSLIIELKATDALWDCIGYSPLLLHRESLLSQVHRINLFYRPCLFIFYCTLSF